MQSPSIVGLRENKARDSVNIPLLFRCTNLLNRRGESGLRPLETPPSARLVSLCRSSIVCRALLRLGQLDGLSGFLSSARAQYYLHNSVNSFLTASVVQKDLVYRAIVMFGGQGSALARSKLEGKKDPTARHRGVTEAMPGNHSAISVLDTTTTATSSCMSFLVGYSWRGRKTGRSLSVRHNKSTIHWFPHSLHCLQCSGDQLPLLECRQQGSRDANVPWKRANMGIHSFTRIVWGYV